MKAAENVGAAREAAAVMCSPELLYLRGRQLSCAHLSYFTCVGGSYHVLT